MLWKVARAGQSKTNACRNLHQLINTNNILYPVPIDCGLIRVAVRKPEYKTKQLYWPFLRMSAWVKSLLNHSPGILLGGNDLANVSGWQTTFARFWGLYRYVNASLLYTKMVFHWKTQYRTFCMAMKGGATVEDLSW